MTGKRQFCPGDKCKNAWKYAKRTGKLEKGKGVTGEKELSAPISRPQWLNPQAAAYWDKVAPTVQARGHLNVLSEDAFAELCDLHSRLTDINSMINNGTTQECQACGATVTTPGNRSLLQIDDKWSIKDGMETACFKESALSDLKRKYSRQFLDYCKQFYLTPLSNRGNFGLEDIESGKEEEKNGTERFF